MSNIVQERRDLPEGEGWGQYENPYVRNPDIIISPFSLSLMTLSKFPLTRHMSNIVQGRKGNVAAGEDCWSDLPRAEHVDGFPSNAPPTTMAPLMRL